MGFIILSKAIKERVLLKLTQSNFKNVVIVVKKHAILKFKFHWKVCKVKVKKWQLMLSKLSLLHTHKYV